MPARSVGLTGTQSLPIEKRRHKRDYAPIREPYTGQGRSIFACGSGSGRRMTSMDLRPVPLKT